jgi:hypothetical protein
LFSILSEQAIRLYSLSNSNDEKEYNHTAELLNLSQPQIQYVKDTAFTLSLCDSSEMSDAKMWNDYAHTNDKEGCCIVFKICNDPLKWKNFHLSKVKYNETSEFEKFYQGLKLLKRKYPQATFNTTLDRLMIFHKTDDWKNEKEIRLATYCGDYMGHNDRLNKRMGVEARIETAENGSKKIRYINYTTLPLIGIDNGNTCSEKVPHIEIERIVIGNKGTLKHDDLYDLQRRVSRLANPDIRGGLRTKYIRVEIRS